MELQDLREMMGMHEFDSIVEVEDFVEVENDEEKVLIRPEEIAAISDDAGPVYQTDVILKGGGVLQSETPYDLWKEVLFPGTMKTPEPLDHPMITPAEGHTFSSSNYFVLTFLELFEDQILGIAHGVEFPGYEEDNDVTLEGTCLESFYQAIEHITRDRKFYIRSLKVDKDALYRPYYAPGDIPMKTIKTVDGMKLMPVDQYNARIILM